MNVHICCVYIKIIVLVLQHASSKSLQEIDSDHGHILKSDNRRRRRSFEEIDDKRQCAVMYKNEQPIGILQPYKNSYQLLPIHSEESVPVDIGPVDEEINKREAAQESAEAVIDKKNDDSSRFSDEKYPYIFAKFKIDSKVDKEQGNRKSLHKREYEGRKTGADSLNSALSRIQTDDDQAEADLKDVLNDMGFIDDAHIDKRQAELIEDEDLEHGTNKVNLIKMVDNDERTKRNELVSENYGIIEIPEPKTQNEDQYIDEYINQHPEQLKPLKKKEREKRAEDAAKEMERQIKERLQKIKEEVRNEIESIRGGNNEADDDDDNNNSHRKKRNAIATLVDKETSDLNPVLLEEGNLIPHIRRKRHVEDQVTTENRPFLLRNLKEYIDIDYESRDETSETTRVKKACKCGGKDCKCDKSPALLAGTSDGSDFVYFDGAPMPISNEKNRRPRNLRDGLYMLDLKPDIYRITDEDGALKTERKKRDLVAIHGGGPIIDHLMAIRERSMLPRMRVKRTAGDQTGRPLTLTDMSDEDLFGALPEGFEGGELARYKRVK